MESSPPSGRQIIVEPEAGPSWDERAALDPLSAVIDPADTVGMNNRTIDELQRRVLKRAFPPLDGLRVLDFGCGTGRMSGWISGLGGDVVGTDASPAMIAAARQNWPSIEFVVLDEERLPFEDSSFDMVLVIWVLQYLVTSPGTLDRTIQELRRVLRPGGSLFAIEQVHAGVLGRGAGSDDYAQSLRGNGFAVDRATVIRRSDSRFFAQLMYRPWLARVPGILAAVTPESRLRGLRNLGAKRYADVLFHAHR